MKVDGGGSQFPLGPLFVVLAAFALSTTRMPSMGDVSFPGAARMMGVILMLAGAGGLLGVALGKASGWISRSLRFGLLVLAGSLLVEPTWGAGLGLGVALLGLGWGMVEERRY